MEIDNNQRHFGTSVCLLQIGATIRSVQFSFTKIVAVVVEQQKKNQNITTTTAIMVSTTCGHNGPI